MKETGIPKVQRIRMINCALCRKRVAFKAAMTEDGLFACCDHCVTAYLEPDLRRAFEECA